MSANNGKNEVTVKLGVGLGTAVAAVISYDAYHSVLWAIIHGLFSWFYILYFLLTGAA